VTLALVRPVPVTPAAAPADEQADASEQLLVAAAQSGSREAFGELVSRHERAVFRTALAALGVADEAEDAAQDAFVTAWRKLPGFRRQASFRTWLLTIAWRKALDRRRRRRLWLSRIAPVPDADHNAVDLVHATGSDPERQAVSADLVRRARIEIRRLSPRLRDALLLACSGAHRYEEIAAMLRVPVGTVKWRVAEARRILSARLPDAARSRGKP
jgi:RNA polymerase sigma-70 factor (ECF subfamily)